MAPSNQPEVVTTIKEVLKPKEVEEGIKETTDVIDKVPEITN